MARMNWMRRLLLLPLLFLATCDEESKTAAAQPEPKGPYLWEATSELGTVYLFGTIHIPAPEVLDLPQVVRDAIGRADVVLTELKLDRDTAAAAQKMMMLPPGETLKTVLPPEDYERLVKKGVPLAGMSRMKVWAAAQQLLLIHGAKYFMSGRQPMDMAIPREAEQAGKEVGALETPEEQIAVFETLTLPEQIRMLDKMADLVAKDRREKTDTIGEMVKIYLEGDLEKIMKFSTTYGGEPDATDKKLMKALLDDRNVRMAERLVARMKEKKGKTWFVAVGAAHHWGPTGLPALLRKQGFKVKRTVR